MSSNDSIIENNSFSTKNLLMMGLPLNFGKKSQNSQKRKNKAKPNKNKKQSISSQYYYVRHIHHPLTKTETIFIDGDSYANSPTTLSSVPKICTNINDKDLVIRILAKQQFNQARYINTLQQKILLNSKLRGYKDDYECECHLLNPNEPTVTIKYQKPIETISEDQITQIGPISPQNQQNGFNSTENTFLNRKCDEDDKTQYLDADPFIVEPNYLKVPPEHTGNSERYLKCLGKCGKKLSDDELTVFRHFFTMRFDLFTRFDEGIELDYESWYSVTPEAVASHIARRMACNVLIDGFCGAGGNTVQFAATCDIVYAIDNNAERLRCAQNNAAVYGVKNVEFILGDFLKVVKNLFADCVFVSPPWGGPEYSKDTVADLKNIGGFSCFKMVSDFRKFTKNICLMLPRTVNQRQVANAAQQNKIEAYEIDHVLVANTHKFSIAYFGDLVQEFQ